MSLDGRVAVVTGATNALGRVVVKALLGQRANVVSACRSKEMRISIDGSNQSKLPV